jgi:hypothetical protein
MFVYGLLADDPTAIGLTILIVWKSSFSLLFYVNICWILYMNNCFINFEYENQYVTSCYNLLDKFIR